MSDQVIAEIERCIDSNTNATGQMCIVYYSGRGWVFSCPFLDIRAERAEAMDALQEFDRMVRASLKRDAALAQTLGLEAAE
jgi:hypothetical protein